MAIPVLPRAQGPIAGQMPTTIEWYNFFRDLRAFVIDNDGDIAQIDDILARLTALENEEEVFATIQGPQSVTVFGSLESGNVTVQLAGDVDAPGNTYYYGTGPDGTKGWSTVASAFTNGDGIDLNTGLDGVTEISFNAATGQVASLPGATYNTVQKTIDVMFSPGIITGGDITELTTTSVRITAGTAVVRIADDNVSELRFFDFPSQDFSVPDVQVTHFYALDYNGGSPTIIETTVTESWDRDTQIPLGSALRGDGLLNVTPNPYRVGDVITNLIQRLDAIGPVQRDNSVGGLQLGETGTRNVTVSSGRLWSRVSDFIIAAKDSSTDTMASVYFNGTNLTVTSGLTQWDNLNFNNLGTGSLQLMANNKYANLWFFMAFNGDHYGFAYGTNEYNTLGDAANESLPTYLTQNFFNQFILLGRFVFQKSAATASIIESAFITPFSAAAINTHNNLGGLQGGTSGEFYHLTSAEYTKVQALPSASQPLDATLTALAGQNWAANALPIGSGADTVSQVSFAANTFPARASTGNLVEKSITDDALSAVGGGGSSDSFLRSDGVITNRLSDSLTLGADIAPSDKLTLYAQGTSQNAVRLVSSGGTLRALIGVAEASGQIILGSAVGELLLRSQSSVKISAGGANLKMSIGSTGNVGFNGESFGGGAGVMFLANATTNPTSNPTGGGILYSDAGAGKWRGSGGTTTTFGPADPHCPECGRDHVLEAENDSGWYQAICLHCLADKLAELGLDKLNGKTESFICREKGKWSRHKKS